MISRITIAKILVVEVVVVTYIIREIVEKGGTQEERKGKNIPENVEINFRWYAEYCYMFVSIFKNVCRIIEVLSNVSTFEFEIKFYIFV